MLIKGRACVPDAKRGRFFPFIFPAEHGKNAREEPSPLFTVSRLTSLQGMNQRFLKPKAPEWAFFAAIFFAGTTRWASYFVILGDRLQEGETNGYGAAER